MERESHNQWYRRPDEKMGRQEDEDLISRSAVRYNKKHAGMGEFGSKLRQIAKQVTRKKIRQRGKQQSRETDEWAVGALRSSFTKLRIYYQETQVNNICKLPNCEQIARYNQVLPQICDGREQAASYCCNEHAIRHDERQLVATALDNWANEKPIDPHLHVAYQASADAWSYAANSIRNGSVYPKLKQAIPME